MSANGNDDDEDINELIRELRRTNENLENVSSNLDRLVNSIVEGARQEGQEEDIKVDLWDVGRAPSGSASTVDDYIKLRRRNANSDELNSPRVDMNNIGWLPDFMFRVYTNYGEHLQRVSNLCNEEQWESFVQILAVAYGVDEELVDILDPSPITFGINVTDGEVDVFRSITHMNFIRAYGNYWFSPAPMVEGSDRYNGPWDSLQLPQQDYEVIGAGMTVREMNGKLADAINEHRTKQLPDKFNYLL